MTADSKTQTPRTTCDHDLADRDTSIADGLCPLCLQTELSAAIKERDEWKRKASWYHRRSQQAEAACIEFKKDWDRHGGPQGGSFGRALLACGYNSMEEDRDAWRSLARRLAGELTTAKEMLEVVTGAKPKDNGTLMQALSAFGQMEKGTSPTSDQPPSI